MKRLLIIAGSDSGGGAGIQADIKTATMHGVFAMTAVTAITVQNTLGVHGVHTFPAEIVAAQIETCLSDIGADAVKTGMLHDAGVINAVARALTRHAPDAKLVLDPVMIAKGGARLVDDTSLDAIKRMLMPHATLVTPNAPEAAALLDADEPQTVEDLLTLGRRLRARGAKAVLMKGGHLNGPEVTDVLIDATGEYVFRHPRIDTQNTHGTGCTLASAIASQLALGLTLYDAVVAARTYVFEAIRTAPNLGHGHGPLNHMHRLTP